MVPSSDASVAYKTYSEACSYSSPLISRCRIGGISRANPFSPIRAYSSPSRVRWRWSQIYDAAKNVGHELAVFSTDAENGNDMARTLWADVHAESVNESYPSVVDNLLLGYHIHS